MMKSFFASLVLLAMPLIAVAEEAHEATAEHAGAAHEAGAAAHGAVHGHGGGVPFTVALQAINFAIYIALLVYLLRKPIANFFKTREQIYKQAVMRGESARRDAEKKKREVQQRLSELESTADDSIANARAEAAALMLQIQQEAQTMSDRLRDEANRTADLEIERARGLLREEMLNQAMSQSRKMLEDKMAEPDQKRLQTEFVDKIQEVR